MFVKLMVVLLSSFIIIKPSYQDNIPIFHFGTFDLDELENQSYEIVIDIEPVTEQMLYNTPTDHLSSVEGHTRRESRIKVLSKRGQPFSCLLPQLKELREEREREKDKEEDEMLTDISSLLSQLKMKCLLMNQGWWTYRYCHGDKITQYHIEGGKVVGKIIYLGHFSKEDTWTEEKIQKSLDRQRKQKTLKERNVIKLPSHIVDYVNGTKCDLSNIQRTTTAKIVCSPYHTDIEIVRIVEHETCNYTFIIHAPQLCDHPLFSSDQNKETTEVIKCSPLLTEEQFKRYKPKGEAKKANLAVKQVIKERLTTEEKKKVPLMDVLQSLASSIADKVHHSTQGKEMEGEEEGLDKNTEAMIDKLVSDTLENMFKGTTTINSDLERNNVKETRQETNTNTNINTNSNTANTGSDANTDTNTDINTDTITDPNINTNTDHNTNTDTGTNTDPNTDTNTDTGTNTDPNTNTNTDTGTNTDLNTDPNTNTNTDTGTNTDPNTNTNTDTGTNTDLNTDPNTNTNTDTNTDIDNQLTQDQKSSIDKSTSVDSHQNQQDSDLEDVTDEEDIENSKFRIYHVKLSDNQGLEKQDIDNLIDQIKDDSLLQAGDKESVNKAKEHIIEIDLSKNEQTSSLLSEVLEQFMGTDTTDGKDVIHDEKQKSLEENYDSQWWNEEKGEEKS